jgi:tripartite-type tricarboxylate transporter receptor subunit TctC
MNTFFKACAVVLFLFLEIAGASDFPTKNIRIIVGQASGGATDIIARLVSTQMSKELNQAVVVDNRTGAAGSIAASYTVNSAPDGYTLLLVSSSYAINPSLMKLNFDPVKDLIPISHLAIAPFILVVDSRLPIKNVMDLLNLAKTGKEPMTYASGGSDSSGHLAGILLSSLTNITMTHIPYRGASPALMDVMSGHVNFMFASVLSAVPQIKQGTLKAIAVSTDQRSIALPDLPTVSESGVPEYSSSTWYGLLAPKGTPSEIVDKLSIAAHNAITAVDVRQQIASDGAVAIGSNAKTFQTFLNAELKRFERLAEISHAKGN